MTINNFVQFQNLLKRSGSHALGVRFTSKRPVERWFQKFRCGNNNLHDEERRGQHFGNDNEKLKEQVKANPHTSFLLFAA